MATAAIHPGGETVSRVPRLASAGSGGSDGGLPHPLWRPQMQTFLMQHGIEESDYAHAIPAWREIVVAVVDDAAERRALAIATLLGSSAAAAGSKQASASSAPVVKTEQLPAEQAAAKKEVSEMIARSRKAYGFLFAALPVDLRPLIADVPQGYAFGVWDFLEKKFRSTEQDTVMSLWERYVRLAQEADETFDVYKARVDSVLELLTHAKQVPPAELYATLLLWRLHPRYATAVLTLKTSDRLKDVARVDWPSIAQFMAEYERSHLGLNESEATQDRAMGARAASAAQKQDRPALRDVECYNCHKLGHYASDCRQPSRRKPKDGSNAADWQKQKNKGKGGRRQAHPPSGSRDESSESDHDNEGRPHRADMARSCNRFDAISGDKARDDKESAEAERTYCARVLAGLAMAATANSSEFPSRPPLRRLIRPGEAQAKEDKKPKEAVAPRAAAAAEPKPAVTRREPKPTKSLDAALRSTTKAVDSAASVSMTSNRDTLVNVRRCAPMPIKVADGAVVTAMYKGDLPLRLRVDDDSDRCVRVTIPDVYYHERFDANLLSWGLMREAGWGLHSTKSGTYLVTPGGKRIAAGTRGRLTLLEDAGSERVYGAQMGRIVCATADDALLLHRRMGHASWTQMVKTCKADAALGAGDVSALPAAELAKAEVAVKACTACTEAKAHRNALGHQGLDKGSKPGEVIHMDTFYAVARDAASGEKRTQYCLLATDAHSEWRWASWHNSRAELPQAVLDILRNNRSMTGRHARLLVADLGGEFDNRLVSDYCRRKGTQLQLSPARAKEMNGLAEKSVDTVKNHVRAMLLAAGMDERAFMAKAVNHHIYVWNRTHVGSRTGVAPLKAMTGREPSILNIGEFGCDAYVHQDRTRRDTTFSRKAEPAIYLGHSGSQNCPIVRMLRTGKVLMARDVQFREGAFTHLQALREGREDSISPIDVADISPPPSQTAPQSSTPSEEEDGDEPSSLDDDENKSSSDASEPPRFRVRSITDVQHIDGTKRYRVKWIGYTNQTWEPAAEIEHDAPDAVREYEAFLERRSSARATRSQARPAAAASSSSSPASPAALDSDDEQSAHGAAAAYAARCL